MAESRGVGYTVYDAFEAVAKGADTQAGTGGNAGSYEEFLEWIRKQITDHHSGELAKAIGSEEAASTLRTLIAKYISSAEQNAIPAGMALQELIDTIYQDMAGLGVLTELLIAPDVEEININGFRPGGIEVIRSKGLEFLKQGFPSADAALNTIKKMVRMGGQTLDASNPVVDSDLGDGVTRISAYIPPVARKEDGVIASIRRQRLLPVTREDYITNGMVTAEMLDFLTCCVINGCSVSFAGGMGSGKTTDLTFLLNQYIRENSDPNNRVMVIGDTDEVRTITWDEKHNRPARVIYGLTSPSPVKKTMRDLVKEALRQNAHAVRRKQIEADATMAAQWREFFQGVALVCCIPVIFRVIMYQWYLTLVTTTIGRALMVAEIISIGVAITQARKINRPITLCGGEED